MSSLPPECVGLIVGRYVQDIESFKHLHPLLLVNKYFFYETVPYLYEDPFPLVDQKNQLTLIALLVRCIPPEKRTQLLSIVNIAAQSFTTVQELVDVCQSTILQTKDEDDGSTATTAPSTLMMHRQHPQSLPTINYLSYVKKFGYKEIAELFDHAFVIRKLVEALTTLRANPEIVAELSEISPGMSVDRLRIMALRPQLTSELIWGLTQPHLEQVQSILLPLPDIDRYHHDKVTFGRLQSLTSITLYIDDRPEHLLQARYEQWVQFVRRHTQAFPRVLRDIRWHRTPGRESFGDPPPEIEDAWSKALPPLDCPQQIDASSWSPMLKKWEEIDFSHCRIFIDPMKGDWPQTKILSKCRRLRQLTTMFTNPNAFQWAIDEKVALSTSIGGGDISIPQGQDQPQEQDPEQPPPLVPLRMLNVRCSQSILDQVMRTALEAFHDTLDTVRMLHQEIFTTIPFAVGEGWRAERLRRLELSTVSQRLGLNQQFFHQFEAIEDLSIVDKLFSYEPHTIQLCDATDVALPNLVHLTLKGNAALAFPANILFNTPQLKTLELGLVYRNGYHAISPIHPGDEDQEEEVLPAQIEGDYGGAEATTTSQMLQTTFLKVRGWTWDWSLPRLTKLILSGDFAMRFRFKMLAKCPMLTLLSLSILTEGTAMRTISEAELKETVDRVRQHQHTHQPYVLPHLEELRMNGVWQFDNDATFALLMEQVIGDKLKEIIVYRCQQVPLETVVRLSKCKRLLRKVTMDLELDDQGTEIEQERMTRLGLKPATIQRSNLFRPPQQKQQVSPEVEAKCLFVLGTQRYEIAVEAEEAVDSEKQAYVVA